MKTATITKLSETTYSVKTDLTMSNCTHWAGDMQLKGDALVRIDGVIYNYCPRIIVINHADQLKALPVGGSLTIG